MTATVMGTINIEDVPTQEARGFKAIGVIGNVEAREVANGYTQIAVPLSYRLTPQDQHDRQFTARFNIKQEWLTPEYLDRVRSGSLPNNELIQYNINVKGLLKGLFTSAGVAQGSLDFTNLAGRVVGFRTKPRKDDPSRLDISYFFQQR